MRFMSRLTNFCIKYDAPPKSEKKELERREKRRENIRLK